MREDAITKGPLMARITSTFPLPDQRRQIKSWRDISVGMGIISLVLCFSLLVMLHQEPPQGIRDDLFWGIVLTLLLWFVAKSYTDFIYARYRLRLLG